MRTIARPLEIMILILALAVWVFSFYRIIDQLGLTKVFGMEVNFSLPTFPSPPLSPEPPCPAPCPSSCSNLTPTPTPSESTPTPELTPTPTQEVPIPTPTPGGGVGGPPSVGGPPAGEASPPGCPAETPAAPNLKILTFIGPGQIQLLWDPAAKATDYNISYGTSPGNYTFGVPSTGNVTSFTVGGVGGGTYCFAVRAVNDCAPGPLSNELCTATGVGGGQVLGASTLAAAGNMANQLFQILFIIGSLCVSAGLKFLFPTKNLV